MIPTCRHLGYHSNLFSSLNRGNTAIKRDTITKPANLCMFRSCQQLTDARNSNCHTYSTVPKLQASQRANMPCMFMYSPKFLGMTLQHLTPLCQHTRT